MCVLPPAIYIFFPYWRPVFRRPQYAFQMALQTTSAKVKQVNIMNQGGNWRFILYNLIIVSDEMDSKILVKFWYYNVYYMVVNNPLSKQIKI